VLPTVFIPQNLSSEMPSFDLLGQLGVRADLSTGVLGKGTR
jgi:hypothetical protein